MQQVADFLEESLALDTVLAGLSEVDFDHPTQFKGWTVTNVLQHLHFFNIACDEALHTPERFLTRYETLQNRMRAGETMAEATAVLMAGLTGRRLRDEWLKYLKDMANRWMSADPKARVPWAGPAMSARSAITARQMETWAHGQEVFDLVGKIRVDHDRIRNICHMGVATFGWTHINRGLEVPEPAPYVSLTAPSGAIWEWNAPGPDSVEGSATEFAQVVTQTRNIADTSLNVLGDKANFWMAHAQCFAGKPHDPPPPGTRGPHLGKNGGGGGET